MSEPLSPAERAELEKWLVLRAGTHERLGEFTREADALAFAQMLHDNDGIEVMVLTGYNAPDVPHDVYLKSRFPASGRVDPAERAELDALRKGRDSILGVAMTALENPRYHIDPNYLIYLLEPPAPVEPEVESDREYERLRRIETAVRDLFEVMPMDARRYLAGYPNVNRAWLALDVAIGKAQS